MLSIGSLITVKIHNRWNNSYASTLFRFTRNINKLHKTLFILRKKMMQTKMQNDKLH